MFDWFKGRLSADRPQGSPGGSEPAKMPSKAEHPGNRRRLHMIFRGEVQGVGFRWNAKTCAEELGLTGWVRNEWDGSVTMELQGSNEQIGCFFTLFNKQYARFRISYTIDEKKEMPLVAEESSFKVLFT